MYFSCRQKREKPNTLSVLHSCELPNLSYFFSKYPYRPSVAQRVGRGIALQSHDRGTRRIWVVSNTPRPHFSPGKDAVLIVQEAGWAPGSVWTGGKSRPHGIWSRTVQPVVSRYSDWATLPTLNSLTEKILYTLFLACGTVHCKLTVRYESQPSIIGIQKHVL